MKKGLTELVFILDRSGSMEGLESDTIGGYNSLLERQKAEEGECIISTVLFDDKYELLHDRVNVKYVAPISKREYYVRGSTALLDAIGTTIVNIGVALNNIEENERPERVMVVITTDGMENSSRNYTYESVCDMVKRQKEIYSWEFVFLGANIDAIKTAASIGISEDRAVDYRADGSGTRLNFAVMSDTVSRMRAGKGIQSNWKWRIDEDHKKRSGSKKA